MLKTKLLFSSYCFSSLLFCLLGNLATLTYTLHNTIIPIQNMCMWSIYICVCGEGWCSYTWIYSLHKVKTKCGNCPLNSVEIMDEVLLEKITPDHIGLNLTLLCPDYTTAQANYKRHKIRSRHGNNLDFDLDQRIPTAKLHKLWDECTARDR